MILPDRKETVVGLASIKVVKTILTVPNPKIISLWDKSQIDAGRKQPPGEYTTQVAFNSPAVIYDDGASICSPVVAFDFLGNAFHKHFSLIGELMVARLFNRERDLFPSPLTGYLSILHYLLRGEDITVCIGGTNLGETEPVRPEANNMADDVINYLNIRLNKYYPKAELISLVSKRYPNQLRSSTVVPDDTLMAGFLYIPRRLANDDKNHILGIKEEEAAGLRLALRLSPNL